MAKPKPSARRATATYTRPTAFITRTAWRYGAICCAPPPIARIPRSTSTTTDPTQADSWYDGKDGYYYYTSVVNPGESTKNIIESVKFNVPENQKDKYNKETLKAVVRADAVFSKAGTYEQSWSGLSDDVKKMLNNLSK